MMTDPQDPEALEALFQQLWTERRDDDAPSLEDGRKMMLRLVQHLTDDDRPWEYYEWDTEDVR